MIDQFKSYFETLERFSTEELDRSAEKLVRAEKQNTALVIAHLAEMSRRKGALERGYKNLFDYAVRRLNLSEGSVALRLQVANVSRRFPQLLAALAENRMSLTVAGLLAPHLTEENADKLIAECAGMTKREAEEHLVALRPKPVFIPSIRKQPASALVPVVATPVVEVARPTPRPSSPTLLQPATPTAYNFRFSAGKEFKDKFDRLAEVLGVENPLQHMAEILEQAVDLALDKKDLKRKLERRTKLVRTRFPVESNLLHPATFPPRFESASTRELVSSVSFEGRMGLVAGHELASRSSTNGRLRYIAATTSGFSRSTAETTIG